MFTHLRLHSEYSLSEGIIRLKALAKICETQGIKSLALTDSNNIYGLLKFYKQMRAMGVKPILGAQVQVRFAEIRTDNALTDPVYPLILLCKNRQGYVHLCEILSQAYLHGQRQGVLAVNANDLQTRTQGLLALSAGMDGLLGEYLLNNQLEAAKTHLLQMKDWFADEFYIEVSRLGKADESLYFERARQLANQTQTPMLATNNSCFLSREDFIAHEARTCIASGELLDSTTRPKRYTPEQYFKSDADMQALFADYPILLENTTRVAQKCNVTLDLGKSYLPAFADGSQLPEPELLASEARQGLKQRLEQLYPDATIREAKRNEYQARLEFEIGVINQMGFPGYFLIVADFIRWAKSQNIPVGPGRGSGAGSLVAYALLITDLDPLAYDLLFERFLNPERVSMPDFDIDFCMDGRDRVIDYVAQKYGRDRVSQIATHGTMAAKAVIRDVGRVLGHGYGLVDGIAKLIPNELGITLTKALEDDEDLRRRYAGEDEVKTLIDLALSLEGLARNVGKHAGGVVIAPSKLTDFSALICEEGGQSISVQYDKDDIETAGLVKFDFLGLRTLTIIDWAIDNIAKQQPDVARLDISQIPLDDPKSYALLKACQTTAVFQLESSGMKDLIKRLQPDCFEDIVALVALFRPGPLGSGMVDDFINVKHKRQAADYLHPSLSEILRPTYGVILYQEQVMQIAQVLARYSLGEADMLRRAMGKKKPEEMAKQREAFVNGAIQNGVDEGKAKHIFDLMEKFAGYGFNKSHSAAYALLAYQTAYLKAHYPACFMAAVLSADMDNTSKVVTLIEECRQMPLSIQNPSVNHSDYRFSVSDNHEIIYGLGAIKGAGEAALNQLVITRAQRGEFASVEDFFLKADTSKLNKRVAEALIKAGAFDGLHANRRQLFEQLDDYYKLNEQTNKNKQTGQVDMFGMALPSAPSVMQNRATLVADWDEAEKLQFEKNALGLYLTGHPIGAYQADLLALLGKNLNDTLTGLTESKYGNQRIIVAGLVVQTRIKQGKRGKMAFVTLDDRSARTEVSFFTDAYAKWRDSIREDSLLIVTGRASYDDYSENYRINAEQVFTLSELKELAATDVQLTLSANDQSHFARELEPRLGNHGAQLWLQLIIADLSGKIRLPDSRRLVMNSENQQFLAAWLGPEQIQYKYQLHLEKLLARPTENNA